MLAQQNNSARLLSLRSIWRRLVSGRLRRGFGTLSSATADHYKDGNLPRMVWSGIDAAAGPVSSLILAIVLLRCLGAGDYGAIVVALAFSTLCSAIGAGVSASATKLIAEANIQDQGPSKGSIFSASVTLVLALDAILLFAAIYFNRPLTELVFGSAAGTRGLGVLLVLAVISVCVQQLDSAVAAAMKGLELFRRQASFELASKVALVATAVSVAILTRSPEMIVGSMAMVYLVSAVARAIVLRGSFDAGGLLQLPSSESLRRVFVFGGWMWLNALATVAYGTVDRILVGRILGAEAAGEFNLYLQLVQLVHFIPTSALAFLLPVFSRLASTGADTRLQVLGSYRTYFKLAVGGAVVIAMAELALRDVVYGLISNGGAHVIRGEAFVILLAAFMLLAFNIVPYYFLLGTGRSKQVALITTASMAASLAAAFVLIPLYGLQGAALSRLVYGLGTLTLVGLAYRVMKHL